MSTVLASMKVKDLRAVLTPKEFRLWKENLRTRRNLQPRQMIVGFSLPSDIISSSFVWIGTEEGHDYWVGIHKRLAYLEGSKGW